MAGSKTKKRGAKGKGKESPMLVQWRELKDANPDSLLLFRMGDFYETFYGDAEVAARALGITLTTRGKGAGQDCPLAGFPYHKLEPYLARLVRAGIKCAVAEQVEDPKLAKGLVQREVTRIVTAGTLTESALLDERRNNYLAALTVEVSRSGARTAGLAWVDLSTGAFLACDLPAAEVEGELARIQPAELLVPAGDEDEEQPPDAVALLLDESVGEEVIRSLAPEWTFERETAERELLEHFSVKSLAGFGCDDLGPAIEAAGALLRYLRDTQRTSLQHIVALKKKGRDGRMNLDRVTLRTLEVTETLRGEAREGSLLGVVDHTSTAMGARMLRAWLVEPLIDVAQIHARHDAVESLVESDSARARLREALGKVQDLERLSSRVSTGRANGRDLLGMRDSVAMLPEVQAVLGTLPDCTLLTALAGQLDALDDVEADIRATLLDEVPTTVREGGLIRDGVDQELDELRQIQGEGDGWMARFQSTEMERTGIQNLKVGYNSVFGYYIEITHANSDRVPETYIRKQTLKNAERYITPELKEYEEKVLSARERAQSLEWRVFEDLRARVESALARILATAAAVAELDVLTSFAELARRRRHVRPVVDGGDVLEIREGRHPVLEAILPEGEFVPNDVFLDASGERLVVLTGPNMAGKSTYIRQVALLALLAQVGAFVPAERAHIGVVDRIFTRIGAADELARGASTFMVEMNETANILHHATARSLVVLDEVGRGTSTYDGVAIAWAITEHLHEHVGARTLFATHYHELTELSEEKQGIANYNVAVRERGEDIVFLHRIQQGATDKSYGIHVARLAGVPQDVIHRARQVLATLEDTGSDDLRRRLTTARPGQQGFLFAPPKASEVEDRVRTLDPDTLTPREALEALYELRQLLAE